MVDFIKTSRWRNLKNKIKKRKKTDPEQVEIDLSMMAAIENVHDAMENGFEVTKKINNDLYGIAITMLSGLAKDDRVNDILKEQLTDAQYLRVYGHSKEEKDDKLRC